MAIGIFGSGDTMFLVVEELDPTCSCLNPPLSPIHIAWKHTPCHINKPDLGHTHLKKNEKKIQITFASPLPKQRNGCLFAYLILEKQNKINTGGWRKVKGTTLTRLVIEIRRRSISVIIKVPSETFYIYIRSQLTKERKIRNKNLNRLQRR